MKLGIGMVVWGGVTALVASFIVGLYYIMYAFSSFIIYAGICIGIWFVVGGIPLILGIKEITKQVKNNENETNH